MHPRWGGNLLLAAWLTAVPAAAARVEPEEADLETWWKGPVRYLLSREEIDAFRSLETDADRRAFVLKFWSLRDPDPVTPENEFRVQFWKRVESANFLFRGETSKPGWRTDRGKIYILLGPPSEVQTAGFPSGVAGSIRWTYQTTDSPFSHLNTTLEFAEDASGEYRLETHLTPGSTAHSDLSRWADLQELQRVFSPPASLYDRAEPLSALDPEQFLVHPDFYMAEDGNTFVALTVGLGGSALAERFGAATPEPPRVTILGRIVGPDGRFHLLSGGRGFVGTEENRSLAAEEVFLYQTGFTVPPGAYAAFFGIQDWTSGEMFTFRADLEVPDFRSRGFAISSITLARKLERTAAGSTSARKVPFVLGNLRVIPRPGEMFRKAEEFAFYYQIYNALRDDATQGVDVDVSYQFFRRPAGLAGEPFQALGEPMTLNHLREEVLGFSFPLRDWPEADYRLLVTVRDNLSGERAEGTAQFRVR